MPQKVRRKRSRCLQTVSVVSHTNHSNFTVDSSPAFDQFISFLGDKVALENWRGFKAGESIDTLIYNDVD